MILVYLGKTSQFIPLKEALPTCLVQAGPTPPAYHLNIILLVWNDTSAGSFDPSGYWFCVTAGNREQSKNVVKALLKEDHSGSKLKGFRPESETSV